jgi:deazaflavin-dependent oxidoreductase (nitroreductase family)
LVTGANQAGISRGRLGVEPYVSDWNDKIIAEFRANEGRVGGNFEGFPLLLLHSTGAHSGAERVNPVAFQEVAAGWAVFASKGGADTNPDWYHNLLANPEASAEVGTETIEVTARALDADEREPIWQKQKNSYPGFADYETKTSRVIPVVLLDRR